jgi:hypothetical protein
MLENVAEVLAGYESVSRLEKSSGSFADRVDFDFHVGDKVVPMAVDQYRDTGSLVLVVFYGNSYAQHQIPRDAAAWEIGERVAVAAFHA